MSNVGDLYIPILTLAGANSGLNVSFPVLTASSTGLTGEVGSLADDFPHLTSSGESGYWGLAGTAELPALEAELTAGAIGSGTMSIFDVSATGLVSQISDADISFPKLVISATGHDEEIGEFDCSLKHLTLSASGYTVPVATTGTMNIPTLDLYITAKQTGRFDSCVLRYVRP